MSAQTESVDVLADMDHAAQELDAASEYMGHGKSEAARDLSVARAAIAELIEADKEYDAICDRAQRYPCPGMDEHVRAAKKRRAAALARVGGAK